MAAILSRSERVIRGVGHSLCVLGLLFLVTPIVVVVVVITLLFLGPLLESFPRAALAAIVVWAAIKLVDVGEMRRIATFRWSELVLTLSTTVAVLVVDILYGVLVAVGLSILDLLRRVARPHDGVLGYAPGVAGMHDIDDYPAAKQVPGLLVYRYDSPLFFANAENFKSRALAAIDRALKGDYASLLGQADLLEDELGELAGSGMQLSVICAEDADRLVDRPQDAQLILGDTLVRAFRAQCEVWPHGTRSADFHAPITSDKPVLILGGEFDPVTPPRYAQQILKGLPNGRVLVAKGQGHGVMGRGCFPRLVERFVETLDAKHLDAGCIADFGPTPAFIDFNGAGP